jgi:hypothetical protein
MPPPTVPAGHVDLLEKTLFAHLATVRPDTHGAVVITIVS